MKNKIITLLTLLTFLPSFGSEPLYFETPAAYLEEEAITVNFQKVPMAEFVRFVSRVSGKNFIYNEKVLDFEVSLVTGRPTHAGHIVEMLIELLKEQAVRTEESGGNYYIQKMSAAEEAEMRREKQRRNKRAGIYTASLDSSLSQMRLPTQQPSPRGDFHLYKLQYHTGKEILNAVKNIALSLKEHPAPPAQLIQAIASAQWIESTNSILYSGSEEGMEEMTELVASLDIPKKQVFIEVLVLETNVRDGLEFGLEWAAGGEYKERFGYGVGNFPASPKKGAPFAKTFQSINATNTPTGTDQIPIGSGFDLGVIGDIITHNGQSYFSLGSLVSALQTSGNSTIVLNQKIITQDNKTSRIFVGDNLAFTGSTVQTVGQTQQTSTNIEYRDVGVMLSITPLVGDGETITLEVTEQITNVIPDPLQMGGTGGINTTKTDMATQVHVPDQSFLVLSGMIRNTKREHKSGLPCLGGLPLIGAAFSKTTTNDDKRNIIVFVRPQIIHSEKEYEQVTAFQENQFEKDGGNQKEFERAVEMLKKERSVNDRDPREWHTTSITAHSGERTPSES